MTQSRITQSFQILKKAQLSLKLSFEIESDLKLRRNFLNKKKINLSCRHLSFYYCYDSWLLMASRIEF